MPGCGATASLRARPRSNRLIRPCAALVRSARTSRSCARPESTVDYAQADVRDPVALARVLEQWRARYGEPVGLIHGAGLIKDKLIRQKTIESFDRVLETKLYGALNLIRLVRPALAQIHRALFLDRRAASATSASPTTPRPTRS